MKLREKAKGRSPCQTKCSCDQSSWCNSWLKRVCDICSATALLIVLFLPMAVVALGVKLTSRGPVFFRQRRPGKNGVEFSIFKFRTMTDGRSEHGPVLTRAADPRVTWFGQHLRKWKVDEFPQLINVLLGEMSFVGPRPQPTKLWRAPSIQEMAARVLSVRPGITSQATINFRNEEELLAPLSAVEVEDVYMSAIMPVKLQMETEYLRSATLATDMRIVLKTVLRVFHRQKHRNEPLPNQYLRAAKLNKTDDGVDKDPLVLSGNGGASQVKENK
jgi:lipopolysaccharide/colanic/teichoic acid biosynthesis glycosyltransferase